MEVRYFSKGEISILQNAIHSLWAENHILSRNTKLLHHMFYENPLRVDLCGSDNLSFVGLWDADHIVGLFGMIPCKLNANGVIGKGLAATNWIVRPEYSGHGLKLLTPAFKYNPDMMLLLGTNHTAAKLYRMMRWHVLDSVPRWIGICNSQQVIEHLICNEHSLNQEHLPEVKTISISGSSNIIHHLDHDKWNFYWKKFAEHTVGFSRDYDYLKWRYLDHPVFDYQFIISVDDHHNYNGLAVVRIENILEDKHKIGRIVEFMSFDKNSSLVLANAIISLDPNVLFWDFYSFSSVTAWGLESVGFRRKPKWMANEIVIPARFQPIDFKTVDMIASMYLSKDIIGKFNYMDDSQWYVTKGDSDQDRPN